MTDSLVTLRPLREFQAVEDGRIWRYADWFRDLEQTERGCRAYLEHLRWPEGVTCPRCESRETGLLTARRRFWCRTCKYQFGVTSGTLFHDTHAPIWKWLLAVRLLLDSEGGLPSNRLSKQLGGSYKTAWFIEHRVRAALSGGDRRPLGVAGRPREAAGADERVYDRALVGCFHQLGVKHLDAYRAEQDWRARNADKPTAFRDAVLALLNGPPLTYSDLIQVRTSSARQLTRDEPAPSLRLSPLAPLSSRNS